MTSVHLLFLDLVQQGSEEYTETLHNLSELPDFVHVNETREFQLQLEHSNTASTPFDVVVIWVDKSHLPAWQEPFDSVIEISKPDLETKVIIVFDALKGFEGEVKEALQRGAHVFVRPINENILIQTILVEGNHAQLRRNLYRFSQGIDPRDGVKSVARSILGELQALVGYDRATIVLLDKEPIYDPETELTSSHSRGLIIHDVADTDRHGRISRRLLRPIYPDDTLMQSVIHDDHPVILSNLTELRKNVSKLEEIGWNDAPETEDIKSWLGIAMWLGHEPIGVITLDHLTPNHFAGCDVKSLRLLAKFAADAITRAFQVRNERVLSMVTDEISIIEAKAETEQEQVFEQSLANGEQSIGEDLLEKIVNILRNELDCDNCTFFRQVPPPDNKLPSIEEWIAVRTPEEEILQQGHLIRKFGLKQGVAGHVLADKRSRIVADASFDREFQPTPKLTGIGLSMLVVPFVIEGRVIGVISCHKRDSTNHFSHYDRTLVETIARQTAPIIQRMAILEWTNEVNTSILKSLLAADPDSDDQINSQLDDAAVFNLIIRHALLLTNATSGVIHLVGRDSEGEYTYLGSYHYPEDVRHIEPRIKGDGLTKYLIDNPEINIIRVSEGEALYKERVAQELQGQVKYMIGAALRLNAEFIGALFLNKHKVPQQPDETDDNFTKTEEFWLNLFANQAAIAIKSSTFVTEQATWNRAYRGLTKSTENIGQVTEENWDLILSRIVTEAVRLSGAQYGFLALFDGGKLKFKTVSPPELYPHLVLAIEDYDPAVGSAKYPRADGSLRKGICGLVATKKETIRITDLRDHKLNNTAEWQEYIPFDPEIYAITKIISVNAPTKQYTKKASQAVDQDRDLPIRSELAVPIVDPNTGNLIGVINLEHSNPNCFSRVHQKVIELFAQQIAIIFVKHQWDRRVKNERDRVVNLQTAIYAIASSLPEAMLREAVHATSVAVGATAVIFIPMTNTATSEIIVDIENVVTNSDKFRIVKEQIVRQGADSISRQVFSGQKRDYIKPILTEEDRKELNPLFNEVGSVLCLPLQARKQCIGVMWVLFDRPRAETFTDNEKSIFKLYANQIAIAYTDAGRAEKLQEALGNAQKNITEGIERDYQTRRRQAKLYSVISFLVSFGGFLLIVAGVSYVMVSAPKQPEVAAFTALCGLLVQAISALFLSQADKANDRMDEYHDELFQVRLLDILLGSSEQLGSQGELASKDFVIQRAARHWFESNNDDK